MIVPLTSPSSGSGPRLAGWVPALVAVLATGCSVSGHVAGVNWAATNERTLLDRGVDAAVVTCVIDLAGRDGQQGPLDDLVFEELSDHCRIARLATRELEIGAVPDPESALTDVPWTLGDDAELDGLWVRCEQGEGRACDELFEGSTVGSGYEDFGVSCGNRPDVLDCLELDQPELDQPEPDQPEPDQPEPEPTEP